MSGFKKAVRSQTKLRAAFDGPSGSGKTYSSLRLAFGLVAAGLAKKVAFIDTEHGSASKYAGESPDGLTWDFDVLELKNFAPLNYVAALEDAYRAGYDVCIVDSLTHAWAGAGGALEIVDQKTGGGGGNKFTAWRDVTPMHNKLIDALVQAPMHVIGTLRTKAEYILEPDHRGKMVPRKIGTSPIQRDGMEYEFDVYASLDLSHQLTVSKTRCSAIDNATGMNPDPRFWRPLFDWLAGGVPASPPPATFTTPSGNAPRHDPATLEMELGTALHNAPTLADLAAAWGKVVEAVKAKSFDSAALVRLTEEKERKKAALSKPAREPGEDESDIPV